jgi:hypothetical protein
MTLILLPVDLKTKLRRAKSARETAQRRSSQRDGRTTRQQTCDQVLLNALRAKDLI